VVQEAIRFDVKREAPRAVAPAGVGHDAAMVIVVRGGSANGEGDEAVVAHDLPGGGVERTAVERVSHRPFGATPER